jgi:hypothetical protein
MEKAATAALVGGQSLPARTAHPDDALIPERRAVVCSIRARGRESVASEARAPRRERGVAATAADEERPGVQKKGRVDRLEVVPIRSSRRRHGQEAVALAPPAPLLGRKSPSRANGRKNGKEGIPDEGVLMERTAAAPNIASSDRKREALWQRARRSVREREQPSRFPLSLAM